MVDNRVQMPAGFGGLMRFDEEYKSKIMIRPTHVIGLILFIIAFRVFLGLVF